MDKKDFLFRFVPSIVRSKIMMDDESLYSTTDQLTADKIGKELLRVLPPTAIVTDATACIGGSALSLSKLFSKVNAIELDEHRYKCLTYNMKILGVTNVECFQGDAIKLCKDLQQDLIFLDPPWGGPEYKKLDKVSLELSHMDISEVCEALAPHTQYIAMKVPTNFNEQLFVEQTKSCLKLLVKNTHLRKMNLLICETRRASCKEGE